MVASISGITFSLVNTPGRVNPRVNPPTTFFLFPDPLSATPGCRVTDVTLPVKISLQTRAFFCPPTKVNPLARVTPLLVNRPQMTEKNMRLNYNSSYDKKPMLLKYPDK